YVPGSWRPSTARCGPVPYSRSLGPGPRLPASSLSGPARSSLTHMAARHARSRAESRRELGAGAHDCVSSQAIALSQTLRALACLPKAAVRDTQRRMSEESTTPDLANRWRESADAHARGDF